MNQYRSPAKWMSVIHETSGKCMRVAKRFRFPTALVAVIRETSSKCMRVAKRYRFPTALVAVILQTPSVCIRIVRRHRLLTGSAAVVLVLTVLVASSSFTPARTWEGTWTNQSHTNNGPLKCVAREVKPGQFEGTFTGIFKGDPFTYKVTFQSQSGRRGSLNLSGEATLGEHEYQWKGMMQGKSLSGRYTSTKEHGEFVLKETIAI